MHTPGPWWIDDDGFVASGNGETYVTVADSHCNNQDIDEREANARLIAAAPALLTALAELVGALEADEMDDKSNVYRSMMLSANHAIALATED